MTVWVPIPGDFLEATFERRSKRFIVTARTRKGSIEAFLSHTGRLSELLTPGARLTLTQVPASRHASLRYGVVAAWDGNTPVVIDTTLPNKLIRHALESRAIRNLPSYQKVVAEAPISDRRIDFALPSRTRVTYIEVKSCTLARDGVALFPDAPSLRGTQQLQALRQATMNGQVCIVLFLATRPDVTSFTPNAIIDPTFSEALQRGADQGLRVLAYTSFLRQHRYFLGKAIPVQL
jgi:sugar fermentation stimulation protein A